jgi:hypothetical protein
MPLRLHPSDLLQLHHPAETGRLGLQLIKRPRLQSQRRLLLGQPLLNRLYLSRIADCEQSRASVHVFLSTARKDSIRAS